MAVEDYTNRIELKDFMPLHVIALDDLSLDTIELPSGCLKSSIRYGSTTSLEKSDRWFFTTKERIEVSGDLLDNPEIKELPVEASGAESLYHLIDRLVPWATPTLFVARATPPEVFRILSLVGHWSWKGASDVYRTLAVLDHQPFSRHVGLLGGVVPQVPEPYQYTGAILFGHQHRKKPMLPEELVNEIPSLQRLQALVMAGGRREGLLTIDGETAGLQTLQRFVPPERAGRQDWGKVVRETLLTILAAGREVNHFVAVSSPNPQHLQDAKDAFLELAAIMTPFDVRLSFYLSSESSGETVIAARHVLGAETSIARAWLQCG